MLSTSTTAEPARVDPFGQALILVGHTFRRVDEEQRGVGPVDRLERAHEAVVLARLVDLALAPQPRGVDEAQRPVFDLDHGVDRVARRAGQVVHDRPLLPHQAVEERRLADVGAADDRDREDAVALGGVVGRHLLVASAPGSAATTASSSSPDSRPWIADTGPRLAEPEPQELVDVDLALLAVDLVDHDHHGHVAALQHPGDARVLLGDAGRDVDDEQHEIGGAHRGLGLRGRPSPRARAARR